MHTETGTGLPEKPLTELDPLLEAFEKRRQTFVRRILFANLLFFLFFFPIFVSLLLHPGERHSNLILTAVVAAVIWGLLNFIVSGHGRSEYLRDFKLQVIRPIVEAFGDRIRYSPFTHVSRHHLQRSRLFPRSVTHVSGGDHIKGFFKEVYFECSYIEAEERERLEGWLTMPAAPRGHDVKPAKRTVPVFRGFFMVAEFSKHFRGRTFIYDESDYNPSAIVQEMFEEKQRRRIRMDHPLFERTFNVYGSDEIETHYLLTHSMMERILRLRRLSGTAPMALAFSGGHFYLAVSRAGELFDVSLFRPTGAGQTKAYVSTVRDSLAIIEELRLNLRIWSKAEGERSGIERFLQRSGGMPGAFLF